MSDIVKKTAENQAQSDMFQSIVESILPKVQPLIKPATEGLKKYINSGKMLLLKSIEGEPYVFVINESDVDTFTLKDDKSPDQSFEVEELIEKILSGDLSV